MFDKFQDYMYYLLFGPLKKIVKVKNQFYILFKVFGKVLDQTKEDIFKVREQSMIVSSNVKMLVEHGADRTMKKLQDETEEQYRTRLSMKNIIAEKAGSNEGIIYALKSLGFKNFYIEPLWKEDLERWAEFYVFIDEKDMDLFKNFNSIRNAVRDVKMASSLPNYGFIVHVKNSNLNDVSVINTFPINFFGNRSLYLDGSWLLDGNNLLSGYENYVEPIRVNTINNFNVNVNEIFSYGIKIEKDSWSLDGSYSLDGTKLLDSGAIIEEVL